MQRRDEERILRNDDPHAGKAGPDVGIVQDRRRNAGIGVAGMAAAGAAGEPCRMRVVPRRGAMPDQEDDPREVLREPHAAQDRRRARQTIGRRNAGEPTVLLGGIEFEPPRRDRRVAAPAEPETVRRELAEIAEAGRFHEGEGRDGRAPEHPRDPPGILSEPLCSGGIGGDRVADHEAWLQENRVE